MERFVSEEELKAAKRSCAEKWARGRKACEEGVEEFRLWWYSKGKNQCALCHLFIEYACPRCPIAEPLTEPEENTLRASGCANNEWGKIDRLMDAGEPNLKDIYELVMKMEERIARIEVKQIDL
jgi:hypothetical protein